MKPFSSLAAVVALWLSISFSLWVSYRLFRRRDGARQKRLSAEALGLVDEGGALFGALRARAFVDVTGSRSRSGDPEEALQDDVRALLNAIEEKSAYFDRVKAAKKKVEKTFGLSDFAPLSEILQVRRDFWAASEIFLIEDIRVLGAELGDATAYEAFKDEALTLLFRDESAAGGRDGDPVALRLCLAREEAAAFKAEVEDRIAAELEKGRAPTPAEILTVPANVFRSAAFVVRDGGAILSEAAGTARSFALSVGSKGFKMAADELRKARGDLPGQFASAFERAGGLARKGGEELKRHYEFLLEAQELRARYAELLARAPIVTEKGKQFLARLELQRRAEQLRGSSGSVANWVRRRLVIAIAHLISGLQFLQAKITPQQNKQLAVVASAQEARLQPAADTSEEPFRALLLPSSAYEPGNRGRACGPKKTRRRAYEAEATPSSQAQESPSGARLRDLVTEDASLTDYGIGVAGVRSKRKGRAAGRSRSLLDRLSSVEDDCEMEDFRATREKRDLHGQPARAVKSMRN